MVIGLQPKGRSCKMCLSVWQKSHKRKTHNFFPFFFELLKISLAFLIRTFLINRYWVYKRSKKIAFRGVSGGWAGWEIAHPDFGRIERGAPHYYLPTQFSVTTYAPGIVLLLRWLTSIEFKGNGLDSHSHDDRLPKQKKGLAPTVQCLLPFVFPKKELYIRNVRAIGGYNHTYSS